MNRATSPTGWARNPDGTPGYTWNPITGCLNGCDYCYARKLANTRLRDRYLANDYIAPYYPMNDSSIETQICRANALDAVLHMPFYPRFWEDRIPKEVRVSIKKLDNIKSKGIFVCDMSDLFGIGIPEKWTWEVLRVITFNQWHRFYLLTKQPQNLAKLSPFPDNCWVGVTTTNHETFAKAIVELSVVKANIKYLSVEPLLDWRPAPIDFVALKLVESGIKWVIIGACTGSESEMRALAHKANRMSIGSVMPYGNKWTLQPKIEWVQEIVQACDKAGIPVFLKDNLKPLLPEEVPFYKEVDINRGKWIGGADGRHACVLLVNQLRQEMPDVGRG